MAAAAATRSPPDPPGVPGALHFSAGVRGSVQAPDAGRRRGPDGALQPAPGVRRFGARRARPDERARGVRRSQPDDAAPSAGRAGAAGCAGAAACAGAGCSAGAACSAGAMLGGRVLRSGGVLVAGAACAGCAAAAGVRSAALGARPSTAGCAGAPLACTTPAPLKTVGLAVAAMVGCPPLALARSSGLLRASFRVLHLSGRWRDVVLFLGGQLLGGGLACTPPGPPLKLTRFTVTLLTVTFLT